MTVLPYDFQPESADADNWSVARRMVSAFAPQAQAVADMTVFLNKGWLLRNGAIIDVAPHSVGPFLPATQIRVDRIVVDRNTGATSIVSGVEGSTLPQPAPAGALPIARVTIVGGMTAITNAALDDERIFVDQASSGGGVLDDNLTALSELDDAAGLLEQTGPAAFAKRPLGVAAAGDVLTRGDADARYLRLSGGALTGDLTLAGNPDAALKAAPKQYVDQEIADLAAVSVTGAGLLTGGGDLTAPRVITMANVAQNTVVGRTAAGMGAPAALSAPMIGVATAADAAASRAVLGLGDAALHAVGTAAAADLPTRGDADARYLQLSGGALTGDLTLAGNPDAALKAAPKQYVDQEIADLAAVSVTGAGLLTGGGDLTAPRVISMADMAQNTIIGRTAAGSGAPAALSAPMIGVASAADPAASRAVLGLGDAALRNVGTAGPADLPTRGDADARYLQLSGGALTGDLTLDGDPAQPLHAVTKQYVDNLAAGLDVKASARAASVADLALFGEQIVDGVALTAGYRVLVKNQSDAAENGLYVVASDDWSRSADADAWERLPGAFVFVEEGDVNADTGWVCAADAGGVLDADAVVWSQFSGVGAFAPLSRQIIAGTGLTGGGDLSANRTLALANTAVTPGAYGSAAQIATFSVDAQGRLTAAGEAAVTPAAIGAAASSATVSGAGLLSGGGDLTASRTISMADVAENTVIGRTAAGSGAPSALPAPMIGVVTAADPAAARAALGVAAVSDVQPHDADLDALAGLTETGLIARTGDGAAAARSVQGAGVVTVADGDGVAGDPVVSVALQSGHLLGRSSAGAGEAEEIALGAGLTLANGELSATATGAEITQTDRTYLTSGGSTNLTGKIVLAAYEEIAGPTLNVNYNTPADYQRQSGVAMTGGAAVLATSGGGGAVDSATKLLIHADGPDGSTEIVDKRGITPFGTHCAYFDGTSHFKIPQSHKLAFGAAQDFTVEFWVRVPATGSNMVIIDTRPDGAAGSQFSIEITPAGALHPRVNGAAYNSSQTLTPNTWYHIAYVRSAGTTKNYINGVSVLSFADTYAYPAAQIVLGCASNFSTDYFTGWMDEFRVSKVARYTADFTPHATPHVRDADTVYLFHFDDGHGSQFIRDDSRSGHEVEAFSSSAITTSRAKFGVSSWDGALRVAPSKSHADFNMGAENFTVSAWVYPTAWPASELPLFDFSAPATWSPAVTCTTTGALRLSVSSNNSTHNLVNSAAAGQLTLNAWNNVAWTRDGATIYVFVNGIMQVAAPVGGGVPVFFNPSSFSVNRSVSGSKAITGQIDEVLVKRGVAEWTANFTPPTAPHTTDDRTVLLLHFNGANGDKVTLDSSESSYGGDQFGDTTIPALTFQNGAALSTAQTRGGHLTSLALNGTNQFASATFAQPGTGHPLYFTPGENFCIEGWFYFTTNTMTQTWFTLIGASGDRTKSIRARWSADDSSHHLLLSDEFVIAINGSLAVGWRHLAVVREPRGWVYFVDGVAVNAPTGPQHSIAYANEALVLHVGNGYHSTYGDHQYVSGAVDSIRITHGKPRYTANFTPGNLTQDDDTALLWEFNGAADQKWVKELSKNTAMIAATNARTVEDGVWLETVLTGANLRVSSADPKFGAGSLRTDGVAGNYVRVPHRAELCPQGDYTIEAWVKRAGNDAASKIIFGKHSGSYATSSYTLFLDASHRLSMVHYNGGTQYTVTAPAAIPLNTWTHVAATMSSGALRLFVNGTQAGALSSVPAMTISTVPLEIGAQNGGQSPFNGYIDEARISSVARWTADFTPPNAPYGQTYQTGPFWIAAKPDASALDLSAYSFVNNAAVTAATPPGTSLKFLISTDDYATALKRWNGSAWIDTAYSMDWNGAALSTSATAAQLDSVANSAAELQAGLAGMAISAAGTLNLVALLATSNASYTPSLDNLAATMSQYLQLRQGTDYTVSRKKVAGEQTLTVTRVKSGAANHVFDVV